MAGHLVVVITHWFIRQVRYNLGGEAIEVPRTCRWSSMQLRIHTLGPFQVFRNDPIPDTAWKTNKNKILFKLLLTQRGHVLTKEQLIELLWPGLDPAAGDRNLRVAIS